MKIIKPMMATLVGGPFDNKLWTFEIKWDGYRAITYIEDGKVEIKSRNNKLLNNYFPEIVEALSHVSDRLIIDGEIVVLDSSGTPQFGLIQNYAKEHRGVLVYFLFDVLFYNNNFILTLPLAERKKILKKIFKNKSGIIRINQNFNDNGIRLFEEVKKVGLEGVVAKKKDSKYYPGRRTREWLKVKTKNIQEFVVGGFTEPKGSQKYLGALLVGYFEKNKLRYAGKVGTGFNEVSLANISSLLSQIESKKSPFYKYPEINNKDLHWVFPRLVCQVNYREWTKGNVLRHPVFMGLRDDISPKDVKKEIAQDNDKI